MYSPFAPPTDPKKLVLPDKVRLEIPRLEESLGLFTQRGWHEALEPKAYLSNWHIDCMCDYLTALINLDSEITKGPLIFAIPPRNMKSLTAQVFLPPYIWAQDPDPGNTGHGLGVRPGSLRGPGVRLAYISYGQELSNGLSTQCNALIKSDWYQARWGHRFRMVYDQIEWFKNSRGGDRRALSFGGKITGFGADIIFVDDPHNLKDDGPETREKVLWIYRDVLQSRLNDGEGIFVIIMQRSHERDLVGDILSREFNGTLVCLPAEFESKHPHVFSSSKIIRKTVSSPGGPPKGEFWRDTRQEGEVLWHNRFPKENLDRLIRDSGMTAHAVAGQYQQRPSARAGGMFKRQWFDGALKYDPRIRIPNMTLVRSWDMASTVEGGRGNKSDYTVGCLLGRDPATQIIYVIDVIRARYSPAERERKLLSTAILDGTGCRIRIPQDPGSSGKFEAHYLVGKLQGWSVSVELESQSKEMRAEPFAAQCENSFVKLIESPWNETFIDELCAFPNAAHDDQVDAVSAAFRALVRRQSVSAVGA